MERSVSGTLAPGVVTSVKVRNVHPAGIEIIKTSGTGVIWYRLDGEDPEVKGEGSHPVLGSRRINDPRRDVPAETNAVEVKLISDAALDFTVESDPAWEYVEVEEG